MFSVALRNFPHPEEAAQRLSRRPHGADPASGNLFTRFFRFTRSFRGDDE